MISAGNDVIVLHEQRHDVTICRCSSPPFEEKGASYLFNQLESVALQTLYESKLGFKDELIRANIKNGPTD